MTRKEREELKAISKVRYGTTSKWHKLINKGQRVLIKELPGILNKHKGQRFYNIDRETIESFKK